MAITPARTNRVVSSRLRRTVGLRSSQPDIVGTVHSVVHAHLDAADRPASARAIRALALAPTIGALAAMVLVGRLLARLFRSPSNRGNVPAVTYGLAGFSAAHLLGQRRPMAQVWKLDTLTGRQVVRIALEPSHASDVRLGDTVGCWGRFHQDGTFRAYSAVNRSTGAAVDPTYVSPLVALAAVSWGVILLWFLASVL